VKLRLKDGIDAGLCVSGQREFCRLHGIDFRRFAREGIEEAELAGIEDANLARALKFARKRERDQDDG
jgi:hypothetical protein